MQADSQKGQVLLIIVLVMVVSLTVGLSVALRSVTNLRTSTEEENSQRAFSAAEAGIERAMSTGCVTPTPPGTGCVAIADSFTNNSSFSTSVVSESGDKVLLNGGNFIEKNDGIDVWLINHISDTTPDYSSPWSGNRITIYWGSSSDDCTLGSTVTMAALEIVVISGTKDSPVSTRYAYDPCPDRRSLNQFDSPSSGGGTVNGKTFEYKKTIDITSGLVVRIVPLYAKISIGVTGCNAGGQNCTALPSQGKKIESVGISSTTTRKIIVFQGYPSLPSEFFPYVFFSHQ